MDTVHLPDHVEEQVVTSKWKALEPNILDDLVQLVNAADVKRDTTDDTNVAVTLRVSHFACTVGVTRSMR